jgi:hypothetical protein
LCESCSGITDFRFGVSIVDKGNEFYSDWIPGTTGIGGVSTGGNNAGAIKRILKLNSRYALEVKNNNASAQFIHVRFEWYETIKLFYKGYEV